jgi:hypothetical protein
VIGHAFTFRTEPVPQHGFDGVVHCGVLTLELGGGWRGHLIRQLGTLLGGGAA